MFLIITFKKIWKLVIMIDSAEFLRVPNPFHDLLKKDNRRMKSFSNIFVNRGAKQKTCTRFPLQENIMQ